MVILTQCVTRASVAVDGAVTGEIGRGLLVYVGIAVSDSEADVRWAARKVAGLRVFADAEGKLNSSVVDIDGGVLAISNFTLLGDARKGNRPSYVAAARPEEASVLFDLFVAVLAEQGIAAETGVFGAHMRVDSQADGPVNVIINSPAR